MKKTGFTLVELLVSVTIVMIILGTVSLIITSYAETYDMGVKNEETENSLQTFYAYIIKDIAPDNEKSSDPENNYIEIMKAGNPVKSIEVKRSWYLGEEKENVKYSFENGQVFRSEYGNPSDSEKNKSRILSKTSNFDLSGIDLKVSKRLLKSGEKISDNFGYEKISNSDLELGIRIGKSEDQDAERYNYYIEPIILLGKGSEELDFSRGYSLRFAPKPIKDGDGNGGNLEENLVWCGEVEDFYIKGGGEIDVDYKSRETGRYVEVILTDGDISRISSIKVAGQLLRSDDGKRNTYSGDVTIPAKSPFKIEIYVQDNGNREVDFSYLVYK